MPPDMNALTERVLGAIFEVSNTLGAGFLEKVYQRALFKETERSWPPSRLTSLVSRDVQRRMRGRILRRFSCRGGAAGGTEMR